MSYNRVTIPISKEEEDILKIAASIACRRPRDHARYLLLRGLGLIPNRDLLLDAADETADKSDDNS